MDNASDYRRGDQVNTLIQILSRMKRLMRGYTQFQLCYHEYAAAHLFQDVMHLDYISLLCDTDFSVVKSWI
jgi:hypothetical protein